ncbi:sulfur carrier protein ThiS [Lentimicrobium sp.]|jgi:thiamine biosynthesis protein ThiS|uniref:sulfur carrier protein ThiS n=1 Tax=Lentimicrobium sp. TaxID=2034841 RepID=UPI002CB2E1AA|nr:sulfur carrier protein ThiS [Lentimicrobium sp.]HPJ61284.1 sulfur carrier protein ThiS [Lentimicrobium sp.]HPR25029.1 sulfur carrier protein ThiS [Lentimicrobium sp.]
MKINLNNKSESFEKEQLTITELLALKNYTFKMLVVKINGELVRRHEFDKAIVRDGDDVMVLHLVTGG